MTTNNKKDLTAEAVLNKNIYFGYTDNEMEFLAGSPIADKGIAAWVYWTSELYSFGRLYRDWAFYPKWLPLFIYSDHGVTNDSGFSPHELTNNSNVHFTFNVERSTNSANSIKKEVKCVPHPWVTYRRKNNITQNINAIGTLIFFSHSTSGTDFMGHDTDEYFDELKRLPDKYQPIVLCMHMHDICKGYHKNLHKHGIPIVTAGNTSSIYFVDRFYNMVRQFKYACSNSVGSQLYYCIEMGIPYFLIGSMPKAINYSSNKVIGVDPEPFQKEVLNIEKNIFYARCDDVSLQQKIYVEWMLGLNSGVSPLEASWILWREFFRNWPRWYLIFQPIVVWLIRKLGLEERARKYRDRLKENKK
jgi:hypothetical protein